MPINDILKHLPGKHTQQAHAGNIGSGGVEAPQAKVHKRASALGYRKVSFVKASEGRLQVVAMGPKSKTAKKLNIFIEPEGRIMHKVGNKYTEQDYD